MNLEKSKVVVFGGSGFLGSHVADVLSKKGANVTIFDKVQSKYINNGSQKMVIGDILDKELVSKTIENTDYVYHFAAIADIKESSKNPFDTVKYNVLGTVNILEACRTHKVKRFLFGSTIYV